MTIIAHPDVEDIVDFGVGVDRPFFDKFLLSIIDAHTPPQKLSTAAERMIAERTRMNRLAMARHALLGEDMAVGPPQLHDDKILRWMGDQHYRDMAGRFMDKEQGKPERKLRSARTLAANAVEHFGLPAGSSGRLRDKFSQQRDKWVAVAEYHDDVPETIELNALVKVRDILVRMGINMDISHIYPTFVV